MSITSREQRTVDNELKNIVMFLKKEAAPGMDRFSQITNHVYLTNWAGSMNGRHLSDNAIETILCLAEVPKSKEAMANYKLRGIAHEQIRVDDHPQANISEYFEKCYALIHDSVSEDKNILIHCQQGISRSTTIVLYYLLKRHYMINFARSLKTKIRLVDPEESFLLDMIKFVKLKRPCVEPNPGFVRQLLIAEMFIKKHLNKVVKAKANEIRKAREDRLRKETQRRAEARQQSRDRYDDTTESDSDDDESSD